MKPEEAKSEMMKHLRKFIMPRVEGHSVNHAVLMDQSCLSKHKNRMCLVEPM